MCELLKFNSLIGVVGSFDFDTTECHRCMLRPHLSNLKVKFFDKPCNYKLRGYEQSGGNVFDIPPILIHVATDSVMTYENQAREMLLLSWES